MRLKVIKVIKLIGLLSLILLSPSIINAQSGYTNVTATVADSSGVLYINAPFTVAFYDPGTSGKLPLLNGSTFQRVYAGFATNSSGQLSISLPDNAVIASTSGATNTQWIFSICTGQLTYSTIFCIPNTLITISGNSQDISATLTAIAPLLPSSLTNIFSTPHTWSAIQTFNTSVSTQSLTPITAGVHTLGAGSKPYLNVIIGPANGQTSDIRTLATGNRTFSLPDLTGTAAVINAAQLWSGNQSNMALISPTLGGGATLHKFDNAIDTPGAITINAATCTDRSVNLAGVPAGGRAMVAANYAIEADLSISISRVEAGIIHYRICNVTAGNIVLDAGSTFNLSLFY